MDEGLESADAGDRLGEKVSDYIESAAKFLSVDAFVLAVDDIDTAFYRGWPVLEAIRKYLFTDSIKIILSGDIELYWILVRQHQFDMLSWNFVSFEKDKSKGEPKELSTNSALPNIDRKINELEEQYLTKLLPPQNRNSLRNLYQIIYINNRKVTFTAFQYLDNKNVEKVAKDFCTQFMGRIFEVHQETARLKYIQSILSEPVRSSLRVLAGGIELGFSNDRASQQQRAQAVEVLRQTAISALSNNGIEPGKVVVDSPRDVLAHYVAWFSKVADWRTLPRLYPEFEDNGRNIACCAAAASLIEAFRRDPSGMFEYIVKVAATRDLHDSGTVAAEQLDAFVTHVMLKNREPSHHTSGRVAAWLRFTRERPQLVDKISPYALPVFYVEVSDRDLAFVNLLSVRYSDKSSKSKEPLSKYKRFNDAKLKDPESQSIKFWTENEGSRLEGVPKPLRQFHEKLSGSKIPYVSSNKMKVLLQGRFYNSIESLQKYIPESPAHSALSVPFFKVTSGQGFEGGTFSILRIISFLEAMSGLLLNASKESQDFRGKVQQGLDTIKGLRSYPVPASPQDNQGNGESDGTDADVGKEEIEEFSDTETVGASPDASQTTLEEAVIAWLRGHADKFQHADLVAAPVTLARIWTRFHYASNSIREELRHLRTRYLGVVIHRYLIAFLHAVAVELAYENDFYVDKLTAQNPVTQSEPLRKLLNLFYSKNDGQEVSKRPPCLFDYIFTCPLLGFYLLHEQDHEILVKGDGKPDLANKEIFEKYRKRVSEILNWSEENLDSFFQCRYSPFSTDETANFNNLVIPLNTVPIPGQTPSQRPAQRIFTDALAE